MVKLIQIEVLLNNIILLDLYTTTEDVTHNWHNY